MLERGKKDRDVIEIVGIDSLVPQDHLLRKIDQAVDFSRLYEMADSRDRCLFPPSLPFRSFCSDMPQKTNPYAPEEIPPLSYSANIAMISLTM